MKFEYDLEAFKEMEKFCEKLPEKMATKVQNSAMRAGAKVIKGEIEANAPSGAIEQEASGGKTHHKIKNSVIIKKHKVSKTKSEYMIGISKRAYHAIFIEFGTRFMSAKPFARPAIDRATPEAMDAMATALFKGMQRESKKLAGNYFKSGLGKRRKRKK